MYSAAVERHLARQLALQVMHDLMVWSACKGLICPTAIADAYMAGLLEGMMTPRPVVQLP